ncbi:hypothetical protein Tco_1172275, partial [Tanacetum coccineum]
GSYWVWVAAKDAPKEVYGVVDVGSPPVAVIDANVPKPHDTSFPNVVLG